MLANPRTVALLTPDATLTWLCHPEPDSAAVFAHLLGGVGAGHFTVGPLREALPLSQRYVDGTMTVETRWASLQVTDYLPHDVEQGRTDLTRVITGQAKAVVTFAPRPEFGQVQVHLEQEADGLRVYGTSDPLVLRSPGIEWEIASDGVQQSARAVIDPAQGPIVLELRCGTTELGPTSVPESERRSLAESYWSDWADGLTLPGPQARADEALRPDAAGPRARRLGLDPGRGHHLAARGDRWRPQLGLPLLLAPGRVADRVRARLARLARRGRGLSWSGCTGCSRRCPAPSACIRCTRSTAPTCRRRRCSTPSPVTRAHGRSESATPRTHRCSSTSSVPSSI